MQFPKNKWAVTLLFLLVTSTKRLDGTEKSRGLGCAHNPLSVVIPNIHVSKGNRIRELAKLAFENRVCVAFEASKHNEGSVSLDAQNITFEQLLKKLFPEFTLSSTNAVVSLKQQSPGSLWLDYKLHMFGAPRAPLEFYRVQLFEYLCSQAYPPAKNYAGSSSSPVGGSEVGPFTEKNRSVRDLLNKIISDSSEGGMWLVERSYPQTKPLDLDTPFWKILPYGGSINDVMYRLDQ